MHVWVVGVCMSVCVCVCVFVCGRGRHACMCMNMCRGLLLVECGTFSQR